MQIEKKTLRNVFFGVIACIILYWILHETERVRSVVDFVKGIVSPFLLGAALAFILNVPMRSIEGKLSKIKKDKLRRLVAVILTFLSLLMVLTLVFLLLIPKLSETITSLVPKLSEFVTSVESFVKDYLANNPDVQQWLLKNTDVESVNWSSIFQNSISMIGGSVSTILGTTFSALGSITDGVVDAFIAIVFSVYCLFQKETLARQGRRLVYAFLPEGVADYIVRILRLTNSTFSNFLSGQCMEVCILGVMFAVSMAIFRMPFIPLVSVLVAVTAFIPVVGAWAGCILGTFLILVTNPIQAVWFFVMFLILQLIENNLIYPRVVGNSIGLNGMWVLLAIAVGGEIMGVAGMFIMIPVTSVLYTLLSEFTNKHLAMKNIPPEKLQKQPLDLNRKFKLKLKSKKSKTEQEDKDE